MNKYAIIHFDDGYGEKGSLLVRYKKKVKIKQGEQGYLFYKERLADITHIEKRGNAKLLFKDDFWAWDGGSVLNVVNIFGIDENDKEFKAPDDESAKLIFEVDDG